LGRRSLAGGLVVFGAEAFWAATDVAADFDARLVAMTWPSWNSSKSPTSFVG
jgi:hypothetical protein